MLLWSVDLVASNVHRPLPMPGLLGRAAVSAHPLHDDHSTHQETALYGARSVGTSGWQARVPILCNACEAWRIAGTARSSGPSELRCGGGGLRKSSKWNRRGGDYLQRLARWLHEKGGGSGWDRMGWMDGM
jgi:hypothetical protein